MRIDVKLTLSLLTLASLCAADVAHIVVLYPDKPRSGLGRQFVMKVDERKVAKLHFPTYYRLNVPPGVYDVTVENQPGSAIVCHLIAGESCYVTVRAEGQEQSPRAELISPEQAFRLLPKLIPLEPEKIYLKTWK